MRPFIFPLCLAMLMCPLTAAATEATVPTVHVAGEGEIRVVPDRARLMLAAEQMEPELGRAESRVNTIVREYLTAAAALGVEARHLQSTAVQIQPETVWDEKTRRNELVGYRVRRDIQVTVTDLSRLGRLLTSATAAGVTYVSPPQLEASDAPVHARAALARAAEDAQAQARVLAETLGQRLGPARRIDAQPMMVPGPMPMARMMMKSDSMENAESAMGLATGEILFTSRVSVEFELLAP